jgi:hypothetical protein
MEPRDVTSSKMGNGPQIIMFKINNLGFKEQIKISEYFQKSMEKNGFKFLKSVN